MSSEVSIKLTFKKERPARWARHIARTMVKLWYLEDEETLPMPKGEHRYWLYPEVCKRLEEYQLDYYYSALRYLHRFGTEIEFTSCSDVQGSVGIGSGSFFQRLCFTYALRYPHVPFTGLMEYEMTVSGSRQQVRALYENGVLIFDYHWTMRPDPFTSWSRHSTWQLTDGVFVRTDPDPNGME